MTTTSNFIEMTSYEWLREPGETSTFRGGMSLINRGGGSNSRGGLLSCFHCLPSQTMLVDHCIITGTRLDEPSFVLFRDDLVAISILHDYNASSHKHCNNVSSYILTLADLNLALLFSMEEQSTFPNLHCKMLFPFWTICIVAFFGLL